MNFADKKERDDYDNVYVIRTQKEMMERDEFNSNLWEIERENFLKKGNNLYKIPVRDLKIGESIYNENGKYITYRIE